MELVGRQLEMAGVDRFLDLLSDGPAALVLEGEPGMGKTTVWRAAVDAARRRTSRVLVCRASESESTLSFLGLGDLLEGARDDALELLTEPQRVALELALWRSAGEDSPDRVSVARGALKQERGQVDEFMRLVGLEGFADAFPHHLSGGMAQRVALARAMINHPKVLLLDEPLGALDAFTRMRMQDEVLRLWQARRPTMLLVTHDIDEAIYMSDRIVIMTPRPGRIEQIIPIKMGRPRRVNASMLRMSSRLC